MDKCPFCNSKAGYRINTVERLVAWYEWDGAAIDTTLEWISGGKQCYCIDCDKIVTKYIEDDERWIR